MERTDEIQTYCTVSVAADNAFALRQRWVCQRQRAL